MPRSRRPPRMCQRRVFPPGRSVQLIRGVRTCSAQLDVATTASQKALSEQFCSPPNCTSRRSGAQLVHRATLLDALSAGRRRKLTLLSAPAGWGKTTLLAQWAVGRGEDQRFGWLSLDSSDNDPVWFWMYVIAALQKASPGVGTRAVELLAMGADPVQVVLPTLLNELAAIA